jgi:methionyl aminopeptidase
MIPIKTRSEIERMRKAGRILAVLMEELARVVKPGIVTVDLEKASIQSMSKAGVRSAFKGYRGYPANICVSVNEEVVHGIPGPRRLKEGDIVSIDIGIEADGFFVDMADTFAVGKIGEEQQRLIDVTKASLGEAIKMLKPGNSLSDVSGAVQQYVESRGFSVVRDFVGHGIGRMLHEEPQVPNFKTSGQTPTLKDGMVFAVEPMINLGGWQVEVLRDGWTAVTKDRLPSAHFEHTVAIWDGGPMVLTEY